MSRVDELRTRSPAHRPGHARGAGSPQRQRSAGSGFGNSQHTVGCACGAAHRQSARHASRCGHSSGSRVACMSASTTTLTLSPKRQPKKALRCSRSAPPSALPLARGSISGLAGKDVQPTLPSLMRPPRSATSPPPRLPAPVPSPPSTNRTPARLTSCPLRLSTLTLSSHDECRLAFSVNRPHHHDVCRFRCSAHWSRTFDVSETLQEVRVV